MKAKKIAGNYKFEPFTVELTIETEAEFIKLIGLAEVGSVEEWVDNTGDNHFTDSLVMMIAEGVTKRCK